MSQSEFAKVKGLSLSAAKSRIQRARQRMREHMIVACQVKLDSEGNVEDFTPRM
jgi:RNA polymerase sigma-70 factor (ECF subfamily)